MGHDGGNADHRDDAQAGADGAVRKPAEDPAPGAGFEIALNMEDQGGDQDRIHQHRSRMGKEAERVGLLRGGDEPMRADDFRVAEGKLHPREELVERFDQNDQKTNADQEDVGHDGQEEALLVCGFAGWISFAAIGGQAGDQEHGQQAHQGRTDRAKRPKPVRDQDPKRQGHHGADGKDGGHGLPKAFPAVAQDGDDAGDRDVRQREKDSRVRGDLDAGDGGDADEAFEGRRHRAKGDRPTVPDGGQDHGEDGLETQADQDRRANGDRDAKAAHALQEGGQEEGDGEHLQAAVAGKMGDRLADHADGADLVCQAVEQERAPDDVKQVEGEEERFDL